MGLSHLHLVDFWVWGSSWGSTIANPHSCSRCYLAICIRNWSPHVEMVHLATTFVSHCWPLPEVGDRCVPRWNPDHPSTHKRGVVSERDSAMSVRMDHQFEAWPFLLNVTNHHQIRVSISPGQFTKVFHDSHLVIAEAILGSGVSILLFFSNCPAVPQLVRPILPCALVVMIPETLQLLAGGFIKWTLVSVSTKLWPPCCLVRDVLGRCYSLLWPTN